MAADAPNPIKDDDASERRAILDRLARREMTADEAAEALRALGGA
jgi:DNA-binding transcriptional ArsR family regulator